MAWAVYQTKLATHIAPESDIRPHEFLKPCWCGPRVDYPHSENIVHCSFLPTEEDDDPLNPDPEMTMQ